jgi:hypothetical protein
MWPASCQPTITRLKASSTNAKKTSPSQQRSRRCRRPRAHRGPPPGNRVGRDRPALRQRVRLGRAPALAAPLRALDSVHFHQPLHAAARHLLAGAAERLPHPPIAVSVVVGGVQLADPSEQPLIFDCSRRAATAAPLVVRGHRHAQGRTDRLDPEAAAMFVDVAAHFGRSESSSLAKNTLADFKISFARRSSKFSCRKRLISSRSSLVGRSGPRGVRRLAGGPRPCGTVPMSHAARGTRVICP